MSLYWCSITEHYGSRLICLSVWTQLVEPKVYEEEMLGPVGRKLEDGEGRDGTGMLTELHGQVKEDEQLDRAK